MFGRFLAMVLALCFVLVPPRAYAGAGMANFIYEIVAKVNQTLEAGTRPVRDKARESKTMSSERSRPAERVPTSSSQRR